MGCCGYSDGLIGLPDSLSTSPDKSPIDSINTSAPAHVPKNILMVKTQDAHDLILAAPFACTQKVYPLSTPAFCIDVKEQRYHPGGGRDGRYLKRQCRGRTCGGQPRLGEGDRDDLSWCVLCYALFLPWPFSMMTGRPAATFNWEGCWSSGRAPHAWSRPCYAIQGLK